MEPLYYINPNFTGVAFLRPDESALLTSGDVLIPSRNVDPEIRKQGTVWLAKSIANRPLFDPETVNP